MIATATPPEHRFEIKLNVDAAENGRFHVVLTSRCDPEIADEFFATELARLFVQYIESGRYDGVRNIGKSVGMFIKFVSEAYPDEIQIEKTPPP